MATLEEFSLAKVPNKIQLQVKNKLKEKDQK
jgi:hypothetical protein